MSVDKVFQFIGVSLIPIAITILIHLGFKYIEKNWYPKKDKLPKFLSTEKGQYWFKQIVVGLILGFSSIGCYFLGINVTSYLDSDNGTLRVGISTFFPVLAGFVFGWPAASITTIIAAIFRLFIPSSLRLATVIACLIGGLISALASHFILKDKRSKWQAAFFGGLFTETVNLVLLFALNLDKISAAYMTLRQFDILCMLTNAFTASITCLIIQIIEKERIFINFKKDNRISSRIQLSLFVISFLGLIVTTISSYYISYSHAYETSEDLLYNCAFDVHQDFETMKVAEESPYYCADRHIVSEQGFVLTVANEKVTIKKEGPGAGTPIEVKHGNIVGSPATLREKLGRELFNTPFLFDDGTFLDMNYVSETAFSKFSHCKWKHFIKPLFGQECMIAFSEEYPHCEGTLGQNLYYSVIVIPMDEIYVSAGISYRGVLYLEIILFTTLFALINLLVSKRIIRNIETMDASLEKIMLGNLDEEIRLDGSYKEFNTLSSNMNLAIGALKNYAEEVENKIKAELEVARNIQVGSLPTRFPIEKEYNLYASMNPAKEVGGDFYDYVKMSNGRILILNADVSGKGIPAAMFMMRAKTLFKSLAATATDLAEIVYNANNALCEDNESNMFVTAWIGVFNPETGELNYVNAGHTVPLIKRHNKFEEFINNHNIALAIIPDWKFEVETTYLEPGQEVLLYTDGATEAINSNKEMYEIDRLINIANSVNYFNAKQLLTSISDDIAKFVGNAEQFDDITMLLLIYTGKKDVNPENALTLAAKPISVPIAINYVESVLASHELNQKFISRISIVVDELLSNTARYCYPKGKEGDVTIAIDTRDDVLRIKLINSGVPFDPTKEKEPDLNSSIEKREHGGFGIFIVKNTMDKVMYEYKDYKNILHLEKKITANDKINNDIKKINK